MVQLGLQVVLLAVSADFGLLILLLFIGLRTTLFLCIFRGLYSFARLFLLCQTWAFHTFRLYLKSFDIYKPPIPRLVFDEITDDLREYDPSI